MERVTYPDAAVVETIHRSFIPVQFNVAEQPEVMDTFNTPWTPTLIVQDAEGREHRRSQGYLDAQRFVAEMALARMKEAIDRRDYEAAYERIGETLVSVKGDPYREPEGLYWAAVATYKARNEGLLDGWNRLMEQYPDSEWAKRVEFIRM
jgi:hypothetical protein